MTQAYFRYYFFTLLAATSVSSPGYSATLIDPSLNAPVVNTEAAVTPASGPYSYKYSQDYPTFVTNVSDRGTNAFASVQDIPIGVTATVNGYGTAAFAQLNYSFELKGPPGTTAPVDVQSFLASVSSPDYAPQQEAEALFSVNSADTHTPLLLYQCP